MKALTCAAFLGVLLAGAVVAQATNPDATRPYGSPRYPATSSAPPAAGTTIGASGTRITNESGAETATGLTGSGDRDRRRRGPAPR